ncbi:hypothetical protein FB446DRAFT_796503 [Lentinula raphanica]|nr:hypothetical protein FB446DRAFT_796503 [Lentinula raphanica]
MPHIASLPLLGSFTVLHSNKKTSITGWTGDLYLFLYVFATHQISNPPLQYQDTVTTMRLHTTLLPLITLAVRLAVAGSTLSTMKPQREDDPYGDNILLLNLPNGLPGGSDSSRVSLSHPQPAHLSTPQSLWHSSPEINHEALVEAGLAIPTNELSSECISTTTNLVRQRFESSAQFLYVHQSMSETVCRMLKTAGCYILLVCLAFGVITLVVFMFANCHQTGHLGGVRGLKCKNVHEWAKNWRRSVASDWDEPGRDEVKVEIEIKRRTAMESGQGGGGGGGNEQCPWLSPVCGLKPTMKEHQTRDIGRMKYRRRLDLD